MSVVDEYCPPAFLPTGFPAFLPTGIPATRPPGFPATLRGDALSHSNQVPEASRTTPASTYHPEPKPDPDLLPQDTLKSKPKTKRPKKKKKLAHRTLFQCADHMRDLFYPSCDTVSAAVTLLFLVFLNSNRQTCPGMIVNVLKT